jgi:hypothetical protein
MTANDLLLVTCGGLNCLKLYPSEGAMEPVGTINLTHAKPEYAVELPGGKQYAVSHKEPVNAVLIINSFNGTVDRSLNQFTFDNVISNLNQPRGLAVVGLHHLLVADMHLNCIVLFDLSKNGCKVVVADGNVANPQTLCWNENRLYVGEFRNAGYVRVIENVITIAEL